MIQFKFSKQGCPASGVPLVGYFVKNMTPENILSTVDLSRSISENDPDNNQFVKVSSTGSNYLIPAKLRGLPSGNILVTDQASTNKFFDYAVPLYYEYQLMYDHFNIDRLSPYGFVTLRKNGDTIVDPTTYKVQKRLNPTASGRYVNDPTNSGFAWGHTPAEDFAAIRLILPSRGSANYYLVEYNKYLGESKTEYWNELVSERPLYQEGVDYNITGDYLVLTGSSRITAKSDLYFQKNPDEYIGLNFPKGQSNKLKEDDWAVSVSLGSFVTASGLSSVGVAPFIAQNDFPLDNLSVSNEVPEIKSDSVIKTRVAPLIIPEVEFLGSGYYFSNVIEELSVNGQDYSDRIGSVDYRRGHILLTRKVNPTDLIKLSYNYNAKKTLVINNAPLSPMYGGTSGVVDVAESGMGIVIVPSGTTFLDSTSTSYTFSDGFSNICLYPLSSGTTLGDFSVPTTGYAASSYPADWAGQPISGIIPSGSILLGTVGINLYPKEQLELIDIRRKGGCADGELSQIRGVTDLGWYDGEPMPVAGTILIQIPSWVYTNIKKIFSQE